MNECSSKNLGEEETRCIDGAAILKFNILGQGGALRGEIPRKIPEEGSLRPTQVGKEGAGKSVKG